MEAVSSQARLHRDLLDRCRSLEASHARLREQFDVLVKEQRRRRRLSRVESSDSGQVTPFCGYSCIPGVFSAGSPYRKILDSIGHAVHLSTIESGEIIYWNHSAEKLYGYKDYEVIGQRVADVLIDQKHHASAKKIMKRLSSGQSWSGQFPFKKRSGQIFLAIVTESPLYEEGELVGFVTVSCDAAVFNRSNKNPGNPRTYQDRANGRPRERGLNLKKIQWHPQSQIASSVSNLASRVLLRKGVDNDSDACTDLKDKEAATAIDNEHVKLVRPPKVPNGKARLSPYGGKGMPNRGCCQEDASALEFSPRSKIV